MKESQKLGPKELDAKIASYFYENGIAFNTAASSSFALMIEESMKLARQYPVSKTGLLMDTSRRRSATSQALKSIRN